MRLTENDWKFINQILLKMYSSDVETLFTGDLLRNFSMLIPFDKASFFLHDHEGDRLLYRPIGFNFPQEDLDNYSRQFPRLIPHIWVNFYGTSIVIRDSDLCRNGDVKNMQYYTDLLMEHNVKYVLTLSLAHKGLQVGVLTLFRERDKVDFTDRELYICDQLIEHLACYAYRIYGLNRYVNKDAAPGVSIANLSQQYALTPRETDVLRLLSDGYSTKDICETLFLAETTVKKHLSSIYDKMNIRSKAQLIKIISPYILKDY